MKKLFLAFMLFVFVSQTNGQLIVDFNRNQMDEIFYRNDILIAETIKNYLPKNFMLCFDSINDKNFNLCLDSAKLYKIVSSKKLTGEYLYNNYAYENLFTNEHFAKKASRKWEKYNSRIANSETYEEKGYSCNISNYKSALKSYQMYKRTGNCDREWRDLNEDGNKIYQIGRIIISETLDYNGSRSYLVWHPTIQPSEILIGGISSDCWRVPIAVKYKKPILKPIVLDVNTINALRLDPKSERLISITKLVNDKKIIALTPAKEVNLPKVIAKPATIGNSEQSNLPNVVDKNKTSKNKLLAQKGENTLLLFDHGVPDGDIVSVYINGNLYSKNITVNRKPLEIPFFMKEGQIYTIDLKAESEGTISPCTVTLKIKGTNSQITMNGKKGEVMNLVINEQK